MVAELVQFVSTTLSRWKNSPGNTINAVGKGLGGVAVEAEHVQTPGVFARPGKGAYGVFLPFGRGRRYGVFIGCINYAVRLECAQGETILYSTTADGAAAKARVLLTADGKIKAYNDTQNLKALLDELITNINAIVTVGSAATQTVNPASQAALNATKAKLAQLLL